MKNNSALKIAFLGGSYESAVGRVHRTAVEMDRRFELVAGCFSRNKDANTDSARRYGVSSDRTYDSLDDLIRQERQSIDAIAVLTPTDVHAPQILKCIEADIPVVSEKSVSTTAVEALELKKTLAKHQGFMAVTYNYTGYPILRELKQMIEDGRFGKIQQIHVEMPQEGFEKIDKNGNPFIPQAWRLRDGSVPTISLDLGVHLHMMVKFLTGQNPIELVSTSSTYGNFKQVVDDVSVIVRYTDNVKCNMWFSKVALGQRNGLRIRLFGETGAAEWVQENPEILHLADNTGGRYIFDRASSGASIASLSRYSRFKPGHPAGFIEAFANYYYDVADALQIFQGKKNTPINPYVFGIDDAIAGLSMLEAVAHSSQNNCWVPVK